MIPNELSIEKVNLIYKKIKPYINYTPVINSTDSINKYFSTNLFFKCEFLQKSGSFKARGAINNIISQDKNKIKNGITAVSAGNHAIASSFVANIFNLRNKIFLYESANKFRIQTCKNYGANIFFTNPKQAFIDADNAKKQGYYFIHPFDGPLTLQGSATLGLEIVNYFNSINQKIDNLIISVGGGGLISGVSSYVKEFYPKVKVIGVEPENANGLSQSFKVNKPLDNINVKSIADSLSAPLHMQYSFDVAKEVIDEMVTITDQQMVEFMIFAYNKFRLMLEPACIAGLAAIKYKIKTNLKNKNTILILCGSNIDKNSWLELIN
ncbi:threonine/serine dehydratase [Pelagibacteraceae bacterium]|nr:threonine/serine dehydratase [Pelagibacteraceae bacterium]